MKYSVSLPRGFTIASLASVYILGFVITPYWNMHASAAGRIFYCVLTIGIGLIWLYLSTNSLQIEFSSKDIWFFLVLFVGMIVLNYRALNSVIPFRGDETIHIERTIELAGRIPSVAALVIAALFLALLVAGLKKQRWLVLTGIVIIIGTIFFFLKSNSFEDLEKTPVFFLRYPFINYWLYALLPKLASVIGSPYHEVLYRVVPFLSMIGTAWVVQKRSEISSPAGNIAWGMAVATIPLIFYYSSILYIEPPAVFLMTIVCLDISSLLHKDNQEILQVPGWYALILIGFIKETTTPFLLCFIAVRWIVQLQTWSKRRVEEKSGKSLATLFAGEVGIVFSILAPVALYLYFRSTLTNTRSFVPQISNLFNPQIYYFTITSMWEQLGPFLVFFLGGCILLIRKREFASVLGYLSLILVILAFYAMDDYKVYIGYSRFNLFILPPVLAISARFIGWAAKQKQYIGNTLILAALAGNIVLSPVYLDGTKKPYWGNQLTDTSEHYYPYQDALIWLKKNYPEKRMLFTGLDFHYPFQFYWNKLDWKPKRAGIPSEDVSDEQLAIANVLRDAESGHYDIVVYRVLDENLVLPQETGEFRTQVIKNSAHRLIIFYKP